MGNFTSAQFRSLIDALNLIENVIENTKPDDQEVNEKSDMDQDEMERERKSQDELRAYRQEQGRRAALRQHEQEQRKKLHKSVEWWADAGKERNKGS